MNDALVRLLKDDNYVKLLQNSLPRAFEVADAESRRIQQRKDGATYEAVGQEVGVVREKIIVAFLRYSLGDMNVELPRSNTAMRDVLIFGEPLEIKTATGSGAVKVKWTADAESAQRDIENFRFTSDLLLIRIWWDKNADSVFYIPKDVLNGLADVYSSAAGFLQSSKGTNNRGINIRQAFISKAENHSETFRIRIHWKRIGIRIDPMARWMAYWADRCDRDPLYG